MSEIVGPNYERELPAWLVSVARQMARDCRSPGQYRIEFVVDGRRSSRDGVEVTIAKLDVIREWRPGIDGRY